LTTEATEAQTYLHGRCQCKRETQISATISVTIKDLLERLARSTGMKKGRLIENALRHHLLALQELPAGLCAPGS
jgi:hypothetical protein